MTHEDDEKMVAAALAADREAALRDVFAATALGSIIASAGWYDTHYQLKEQTEAAYKYADAMLEARKK